ncbi:LacI family DNA-binding transcriptional regulator [Tsukamurella soli]|uniref:LacI family DNA-binding transcriptional regulator n=2 Tax=Tsukamurella soli TaxID=644556 RepID=A0ABP8JIL4_9ACTN
MAEEGASVRRPTLLDVARRAGVSRATASLVIRDAAGPSEASRVKVRAAADELGYRPDVAAQLLRSRSSRLLGVMFRAADPFHADLVEHIYAAAEAAGYDVVLSAVVSGRDERRAVDALVASRCEAIILLGGIEVDEVGGGLPAVGIGRRAAGSAFDGVYTDDGAGTRSAVEHLVALGHRRIVHLDGGAASGAAERRAGYQAAMRGHGLAPTVIAGGFAESDGAECVRRLLAAGELPTAIVAGNDQAAVGVVVELRRAGVDVPGQVSVVGFDDSRAARLAHLDLTTVRQDAAELARGAVRLAVARLGEGLRGAGDGQDGSRTVELAPHLVVRGTTGPVA